MNSIFFDTIGADCLRIYRPACTAEVPLIKPAQFGEDWLK